MLKTDGLTRKILVAPLNWGLGHASRCIPIIKSLLTHKIEVIVACGKSQKLMLEAEFPDLKFEKLDGYDLKYGKNRRLTLLKIISQIPKILIQIKRENRWLNDFLSREEVNAVISDNRYGLFSPKIPSIFITHQLRIKTPFGEKIENLIQGINHKYINRFSECWVPDFEKERSIAGDLSNPKKLTAMPMRYIGCLSRFKKINTNIINNNLLIVLSGPEPQRTIFEKLLLNQLRSFTGNWTLVRGLPGENENLYVAPNIKVYNYLPVKELNEIMCESEFVICRSGYSSVMDIIKLGKKSIVIPTPGQTEQEYLADYLFKKKIVYRVYQKDFLLNDALDNAKKFSFIQYENIDDSLLEQAVEKLIASIK
jgi:uncharacterized protein (TIGR00661 family)